MSKVNIAKIAEDVGTCSENLACIAEGLAGISEKMSAVAKIIAGIVPEFREDAGTPAAGTKTKKEVPGKNGKKAAGAEAPAKEYTFTEVRTFLAEKSRAGHTAEVKKILAAHGADKLSELDQAEYAAVMAEAEVLG